MYRNNSMNVTMMTTRSSSPTPIGKIQLQLEQTLDELDKANQTIKLMNEQHSQFEQLLMVQLKEKEASIIEQNMDKINALSGERDKFKYYLKEKEQDYNDLRQQLEADISQKNNEIDELYQKYETQTKSLMVLLFYFLNLLFQVRKIVIRVEDQIAFNQRIRFAQLNQRKYRLHSKYQSRPGRERCSMCLGLEGQINIGKYLNFFRTIEFLDQLRLAKQRIQELEKRTQQYQGELEQMHNSFSSQEEEFQQLRKIFQFEKQQLDAQIKLFENLIKGFKGQINDLEQESVKQLGMHKIEINDLNIQLSHQETQYKEEIDQLLLEIEISQKQQMDMKDMEFKFETQIQSLDEQLNQMKRKFQEQEIDIKLLSQDKQKLIAEKQSQEKEQESLKSKFNKLQNDYSFLLSVKEELEIQRVTNQELEKRLLKAQHEKSNTEYQLQSQIEEINKKRSEISQLQQSIKDLQVNSIDSTEQIRKEYQKLQQTKNEIEFQGNQQIAQLKRENASQQDIQIIEKKKKIMQQIEPSVNTQIAAECGGGGVGDEER